METETKEQNATDALLNNILGEDLPTIENSQAEAEAHPTAETEAQPPRVEEQPQTAVHDQPKKKGRGRPKKAEQKPEAKQEPKANANLDDILSQYETKTETPTAQAAQPAPTQAANASQLINGYMLLIMCDFFFPVIIKFLFRFTKLDIDVSKMKLTAKEFEELKPVADEAAKQLQVQMSPLAVFGVCMISVYAGKAFEHSTEKKK